MVELLRTSAVTHLSLDHDLGDDDRGTGYAVVLWIEEAIAAQGFTPPSNHSSQRQCLRTDQGACMH